MSDQSPTTPGAGVPTPGPEPAPGAPAEPTAGPTATGSATPTGGTDEPTAESSASTPGPTPPGGPLDGDTATPTAGSGTDSATAGGAAAPEATGRPNRRKVREGLVLSVSMDKTAVVGVVDRVRHPRYVKTVQRTKRLYTHDETNQLRVGDRVRVAESRPMSRLKRWWLVEVLERAK
jgi:small subunit ribosomal protein S17